MKKLFLSLLSLLFVGLTFCFGIRIGTVRVVSKYGR